MPGLPAALPGPRLRGACAASSKRGQLLRSQGPVSVAAVVKPGWFEVETRDGFSTLF